MFIFPVMREMCDYVGSYEKLISEMYLGEIVRRIIVQCVEYGFLFNGQLSAKLNTPHRFTTECVIEIIEK